MFKFFKIITLAVVSLLFMSCGGTSVKVRQSSDGVNATVSVTTNNPTNVEVTPSIVVDVGELDEVLDSLENLSSEPLSFNYDSNGELIINVGKLCKSINPQTLISLLSTYESLSTKSYILTQSLPFRRTRFLTEKMPNFNINSCVSPVVNVFGKKVI